MTSLGRWLAGILNAYIERHNEPVAVEYTLPSGVRVVDQQPPVPPELIDPFDRQAVVDAMARADEAKLVDALVATIRPCWACGDPVGFHAFHLPCWNTLPLRPQEQIP